MFRLKWTVYQIFVQLDFQSGQNSVILSNVVVAPGQFCQTLSSVSSEVDKNSVFCPIRLFLIHFTNQNINLCIFFAYHTTFYKFRSNIKLYNKQNL